MAYRVLPGRKTKFLLVTSSSNVNDWVLPKGHIEPGEDLRTAALRELKEEGGVDGRLVRSLGKVDYVSKMGERIIASFYLVQALREGRSPEGRKRRWLDYDKALIKASHESSRQLLARAGKALGFRLARGARR